MHVYALSRYLYLSRATYPPYQPPIIKKNKRKEQKNPFSCHVFQFPTHNVITTAAATTTTRTTTKGIYSKYSGWLVFSIHYIEIEI